MPKLQSANGRLNVLSKSGCLFYYLFLLFEPCHITISLQERINNSSRVAAVSCHTSAHHPCHSVSAEGTCSMLLRKEVLACFSFFGFEKPACSKPVGICDLQHTKEMRIWECAGDYKQPLRLPNAASTEVPNRAAMCMRTK